MNWHKPILIWPIFNEAIKALQRAQKFAFSSDHENQLIFNIGVLFIALRDKNGYELTYTELKKRSEKLANHLKSLSCFK